MECRNAPLLMGIETEFVFDIEWYEIDTVASDLGTKLLN